MSSNFAQTSPAPGREGGAKTPAPAAPAEASDGAGTTQAPSEPPSLFNGSFLLILALPLLLVMFMTRSQNKKQKALEGSLKVGDRVVTRAGIIGKIVDMGERTAKLEIAPGVVVTALKVSIEGHDKPKDDAKKDEKAGDKDKDKSAGAKSDTSKGKSEKASSDRDRETKKAS